MESDGSGENPVGEVSVNNGARGIETASGSSGMASRSGHEGVREQAKVAGINTVKGMWGQAPKLLPLLGVFFYGLGRFVVDGFYSQLNTTADAAGIGYLSIIEPAAVLAATLAIIGTAVVIIFDMLKVFFLWMSRFRAFFSILLSLLGLLLALGSILSVYTGFFRSSFFDVSALVIAVLSLTVYPLRVLLNVLRDPTAASSRLLSVGFSLAFLVALCFGAHEFGVHEAEKVTNGQAVDMRILGLEMSAINVMPVHIQAINSSQVIKQLFAKGCLMDIGSGPFNVLLFNTASQKTLSVPSSEIVVINSSAPCPRTRSTSRPRAYSHRTSVRWSVTTSG